MAIKVIFFNLKSVLFAGLIILVMWSGYYLRQPQTLPIKTVIVKGKLNHMDRQTLRQAIVPWVSTGFFAADMQAIRRAALASQWIKKASVRRVWPDKIILTVQERESLAYWNQRGIIDSTGELFFPEYRKQIAHLPHLSGPLKQYPIVLKYYKIMRAALARLHLSIVRLHLSDRHAWQVTLNNGWVLSLGQHHVMARFDRFIAAYPRQLKSQTLATVDLRYTNGFAVGRRAPLKRARDMKHNGDGK